MNEAWKIETRAVQCGYEPGNGDPRVMPITQSTTYKYDSAQEVADLFDLKAPGFFYSRLANPTVEAFEKKIAALEGGVAAVGTSSGQTANALAILNICTCGDHFVAVSSLYGGSVSLFTNTMKKMGISVSYVNPDATAEEITKAFRPNTKALFAEALANPALIVLDFDKFSQIAKKFEVPFIVDNTFPSPVLCRPLELGADIVTHSATKFLDGHATSVGGVIVEGGKFNWKNGKFKEFTEPDASYHGIIYSDAFPACPFSVKARVQWLCDLGCIMAPMNAWLTNLGLETLHIRLERHSSNALALAKFLKIHPKVAWVNYPGLKESPYYELA
ncbi:MAG: PLP-dependent transferase, partial [Victivallaceae bacterium]|nr:PLP-dependent transferase [Victivallaceae bacterium]